MDINIVSKDERYKILEGLLQNSGFEARLCTCEALCDCKILLLSVVNEYSDEDLSRIFSTINKKTVVLCGKDTRISNLFDGRIIDYSSDDSFLKRNAYLTAEATVSFLHTITKDALNNKRVFVSGYGRIGSALCKILSSLGAKVLAYARRDVIMERIKADGFEASSLENCVFADIIVNTVPGHIYKNELTDSIPENTVIVDLASSPYGFESMERVILGSALPGKILTKGAATVLYDTVYSILSNMEKELL